MRRWAHVLLLLSWILSLATPAPARAQAGRADATALLKTMTPEERVGQLFLVTFTGAEAGPDSQIYDLIVKYYVGGVVLQRDNDNFSPAPDTLVNAQALIADLQRMEWEGSFQLHTDPVSGDAFSPVYLPLFVGISQEGGGYPNDQLLSGLTLLPSPMAIGAAWQPDLAEDTGRVLGQELATLGVNLLLGPSLDVLESPGLSGSGDLGARVFGGDPYWVGQMGQAYIRGLHAGSDDGLLVIAKHFPGRGSSDRLPEYEVATVRKSLEQLKQIELAPFFAVTGNAPDAAASADGLLVSHIRYQGLQGNIRATTRPVSFDSQALAQILALPEFSAWRGRGGLIVSDDLGSRAVRQFYESAGQGYSGRLVARDAFLAGNDLLYLGDMVSSDAPDAYATTVQTLEFFAQKYREDPAFATRVDQAVLRILQAKLRLYDSFALDRVLTDPEDLEARSVGTAQSVAFSVAQQAATLISPSASDLAAVLPEPPSARDFLIIFTDVELARQCGSCAAQAILPVDAFEQSILRLYGPGAGDQAQDARIVSYSFDDLAAMLSGSAPAGLEADLRAATLVILLETDHGNGQPALIRAFLSERQSLLRDRRVILFSFGAPYYLDATDISKLTAFYGLYSSAAPFVDAAARLLYQELTPQGDSPVSIPGIGYELISVTAPDPGQVIALELDLPAPAPGATPEPTPVPVFQPGDNIAVRTGVILDHNGHAVPDGTVVRFTLTLAGESGGLIQQVETVTTQGVARASLRLEQSGLLQIRAVSEPALLSQVVQLDVGSVPAAVTIIAPPVTETGLPGTLEPSGPSGLQIPLTGGGYPRFGAWMIALLFMLLGAALAFWAGGRMGSARWSLRWALCILIGGLLGYLYLAFGLPGGKAWVASAGMGAVFGATLIGMLLGLVAAGVWAWRERGA